jgi:hypothetical protein
MTLQKCVRFDNLSNIQGILPNIVNVSREEHNAQWFSSAEYDHIRNRERKLVRRAASMATSMGDDFNVFNKEVGLESYEERCERRLRMDAAKRCLLEEQERQWDEEEHNPELLAELYSASTRDAVQAARDRGNDVSVSVRNQQHSRTTSPSSRKKLCKMDSFKALCSHRWGIAVVPDSMSNPMSKKNNSHRTSGLIAPTRR